ncbi:MAG: tRNA 2-thiouridine(34) synthase MnmA [Armatimonadetes bacterium]|nr:tRNA 2-thiouridine(34) synthase MnmA [Armatimonadota bacterium]
MARIAVAMSGGVDSSVAAGVLAAQGHQVIGFTLNLWPAWLTGETDAAAKACCGVGAVEDARAVARRLGIRHYVLNVREEFQRAVIDYFCDEYTEGRTPNPCIACNRAVKFSLLLNKALGLGFDYLATGHYARVRYDETRGRYLLLRAADARKDQGYVLYGLTQGQLARLTLPVGELDKARTRRIAGEMGLPVADKPDSQEICFVPGGDYREVVRFLRPEAMRPGPILDTSGRVLGEHRGMAGYTVGQRRGLGLAAERPFYVVALDTSRNAVIVGGETELLSDELEADGVNWIAVESLDDPRRCTARIRHAAREIPAEVAPLPRGRVRVRFDEPQRAVTPGQAVCFYNGDVVLGGGTIVRARGVAERARFNSHAQEALPVG